MQIKKSPASRAPLIHPLALPRLPALDLLHGRQNALPHPLAVQGAFLEHGIGALGGLKSGVLAVLTDQDGGGAVDVEVGGHSFTSYLTDIFFKPDDELRYEVGRRSVTGNTDKFSLLFQNRRSEVGAPSGAAL